VVEIDPKKLADSVLTETGIEFSCESGFERGERWVDLIPAGYSYGNSFKVRAIFGWRHIEVLFHPGAFAGELLKSMGAASDSSKSIFIAILERSEEEGAALKIKINGRRLEPGDPDVWLSEWKNVLFRMRVGQDQLSINDGYSLQQKVYLWTSRMASAVLALMPLEEGATDPGFQGYPEGAGSKVLVNRYERDPRNRAAAISIHGFACKACSVLLEDIYGEIATGFIEVHHTTPVSELGEKYSVSPREDLVPLCPNCHSIAHRKNPPLSVEELKDIISERQK
jgi:5-methylcytosine-specific restriction enzyme A